MDMARRLNILNITDPPPLPFHREGGGGGGVTLNLV